MDNASIGAMVAVLIDGVDATRVLNMVSNDSPVDAVDATTFRPEGYSREFISGLGSDTLKLGGFLPLGLDTVLGLMEQAIGNKRFGQEVMVGGGGLSVGNLALMAKSLQTSTSTPIGTDGIVTSSADFVNGIGGVRIGHVLMNLHGSQVTGSNEVQVLTLTALADASAVTIGDGDGATVSVMDLFTNANGATVTAARLKAKLESLPGIGANNVFVTGNATFSTTWSGTFRVMFVRSLAGLDVPALVSNNAALVVSTDIMGGNKYNVLTAIGNQTAVKNYEAATAFGGAAMLQVISAVGTGRTLTVKVQHAPDVAGAPGTFTDLLTFNPATVPRTVARQTVAVGTLIQPWVRARVETITGSFVASVGFSRNYS